MTAGPRGTGQRCTCGAPGDAHKLTCRALALPPRATLTLDELYGPPTWDKAQP